MLNKILLTITVSLLFLLTSNCKEASKDTKLSFIEIEKETLPQIEIISISDLVADPKKFEGKKIHLKGKCVKINANIMGLHWIHFQDGTKDDYDLVITSKTLVKQGSTVTISAVVVLNKDFGAGYNYDLILEEGKVIE